MFGRKNIRLLGVSVTLLVLGYVLLGIGPAENHLSLSVAPLILVTTYCVLIPVALVVKDDRGGSDANKEQTPKGKGASGG